MGRENDDHDDTPEVDRLMAKEREVYREFLDSIQAEGLTTAIAKHSIALWLIRGRIESLGGTWTYCYSCNAPACGDDLDKNDECESCAAKHDDVRSYDGDYLHRHGYERDDHMAYDEDIRW